MIVLDILGAGPNLDPEPLSFVSLGEGAKQHNMGKVYSGLYECAGHAVGTSFRMVQLTELFEKICEQCLRAKYKANPTLVLQIRQAIAVLFPNGVWLRPPSDAESLEWWSKMREILDFFLV